MLVNNFTFHTQTNKHEYILMCIFSLISANYPPYIVYIL